MTEQPAVTLLVKSTYGNVDGRPPNIYGESIIEGSIQISSRYKFEQTTQQLEINHKGSAFTDNAYYNFKMLRIDDGETIEIVGKFKIANNNTYVFYNVTYTGGSGIITGGNFRALGNSLDFYNGQGLLS